MDQKKSEKSSELQIADDSALAALRKSEKPQRKRKRALKAESKEQPKQKRKSKTERKPKQALKTEAKTKPKGLPREIIQRAPYFSPFLTFVTEDSVKPRPQPRSMGMNFTNTSSHLAAFELLPRGTPWTVSTQQRTHKTDTSTPTPPVSSSESITSSATSSAPSGSLAEEQTELRPGGFRL